MIKYPKQVLVIIAIILCVLIAFFIHAVHSKQKMQLHRQLLPEFNLQAVDSRHISSAAFNGKKVIVIYIDPQCGSCHEFLAGLNQQFLRKHSFRILIISEAGKVEMKDFIKGLELGSDDGIFVIADIPEELSKLYKGFSLPSLFLYNQQRELEKVHFGPGDLETIIKLKD